MKKLLFACALFILLLVPSVVGAGINVVGDIRLMPYQNVFRKALIKELSQAASAKRIKNNYNLGVVVRLIGVEQKANVGVFLLTFADENIGDEVLNCYPIFYESKDGELSQRQGVLEAARWAAVYNCFYLHELDKAQSLSLMEISIPEKFWELEER